MSNVEEASRPAVPQPKPSHALTITLFGVTMPFDVITATYAILVASGGIMGYVKARSIPSLAAGLTFGCLLATGSYLEAAQDHHYLTLGSAGLLGGMMLPRYLKNYAFMPAGLISLLSIGTVIRQSYIIYKIYTDKAPQAEIRQ